MMLNTESDANPNCVCIFVADSEKVECLPSLKQIERCQGVAMDLATHFDGRNMLDVLQCLWCIVKPDCSRVVNMNTQMALPYVNLLIYRRELAWTLFQQLKITYTKTKQRPNLPSVHKSVFNKLVQCVQQKCVQQISK